jgi:hypothetical protein
MTQRSLSTTSATPAPDHGACRFETNGAVCRET